MKRLRKEQRKEELKLRKNFLPSLGVTALLWMSIAMVLFFVDPASAGALPFLFVILTLSLIFTFSLVLANTRRGIFTTVIIIGFLVMRLLGVGTIINLLLLTGAVGAFEFYLSKNA